MRHLTALFLAVLSLSGPASAADRMRCGSRLVSTQALAEQVLGSCGEPDFVDRWETPGYGYPHASLAGIEQWYYNFGPSQLLRVLRFQHGRLVDIRTDSYGFSSASPGACGPYDIAEGTTKFRLFAACGEPDARRFDYVLAPLRESSHGLHKPAYPAPVVQVYQEEWTYNFGPRNLLRVVTLQNGVVTDVRSEGRGH